PPSLPSGSSLVFLNGNTTFKCRQVGYFADTESHCRLYHVCHKVPGAQSRFFYKYSFMCHNKTVFNQATLTCSSPEESLPCEMSEDFYFMHGNEIDDDYYSEDREVFEDLVDHDYTEDDRRGRDDNGGYEPPLDDLRDLQDLELSIGHSDHSGERPGFGTRLTAPKVSYYRDYDDGEKPEYLKEKPPELVGGNRCAAGVDAYWIWIWIEYAVEGGRKPRSNQIKSRGEIGPSCAPSKSIKCNSIPFQRKRESYRLPDGSEFVVGALKSSFRCRGSGYFADVDNSCQVFHVCHEMPEFMRPPQYTLYSFMCGNMTVFDQLTLTCMYPDDAVPCTSAPDFYAVNDNIGHRDALFLTDEEVGRAEQWYEEEVVDNRVREEAARHARPKEVRNVAVNP
ncbi:unnamed protein product, partial [Ixodes hexagonus]